MSLQHASSATTQSYERRRFRWALVVLFPICAIAWVVSPVVPGAHASALHGLMEWSASAAAIFTGLLACTYYAIRREPMSAVLGAALLGAGTLDVFHALAGLRLIDASTPSDVFIPFTWFIGRTFHAGALALGLGAVCFVAQSRTARGSAWVYPTGAALLFLAGLAMALALSAPALPRMHYSGSVLARPWDLVPLGLYVVATALLWRINRRAPSVFGDAILLSMVPNLFTQLFMVVGSSAVFDQGFVAAHLNKLLAYSLPLAGVLADYVRAHKAVEASSAEAQVATARAEAATRSKATFLATMSHEIRTPMNGVVAAAELLLQSEVTPAQRELLQTVERSGDALLAVINDILDFSKLEAGRMTLAPTPTSARLVLADVVRLLDPQRSTDDVQVQVEIDPAMPEWLLVDATRLRQITLNLVGNALKFTSRGTVRVALRPAGADAFSLSVSDTGIGIAHPEALFEDYVQDDATVNRRFGGTGLGLAITRRLVTQMGGSVSVESQLGVGSTFTVVMPLAPCAAPAADFADGPLPTGRALIVDDNPINRLVASRLLTHLGWQVDAVESGAEATASSLTEQFDIIFMDVHMPVMDGLEATRLIRRVGRNTLTPIVALTASVIDEERTRCVEAGMTGFLPKPLRLASMRGQLKKAMGGASAEIS